VKAEIRIMIMQEVVETRHEENGGCEKQDS